MQDNVIVRNGSVIDGTGAPPSATSICLADTPFSPRCTPRHAAAWAVKKG